MRNSSAKRQDNVDAPQAKSCSPDTRQYDVTTYEIEQFLCESTPTLRAVSFQCLFDYRQRHAARQEVVHFDRFAFEQFVVLKEPPEYRESMRRQLTGFHKRTVFRIVDCNGKNLVIAFAAVEHRHQADRP
jgi:hypothetical protein